CATLGASTPRHGAHTAAPHGSFSRHFGETGSPKGRSSRSSFLYASTSFTDKTLECADCGQQFTHSAQDQQFYAEPHFSEPRRCPTCRAVRKAARGDTGGGSYASGGGGGYADGYGPREMFTTTCAR